MSVEASITTNGTSGNNGASVTVVLPIPEGASFGGIDGFRAAAWHVALTKLQPYFAQNGELQVDINAYSVISGKATTTVYVYYHVF